MTRAPKMTPTLAKAKAFFYKHGGYSYDPKKESQAQGRKRVALEMARAEAEASSRGWRVVWEGDPEPYETDLEGDEPNEVLGAILRDEHGNVLASLWGIGDPSRSYGRVVEAELALEALHEKGWK